ncbi:DUF1461 domain-containing protein, partial [Candidatus Berkelbacteria bacterium]|nr:DUF1461 domain-containing protein [Candidatus Berkelbacteria bacterium]
LAVVLTLSASFLVVISTPAIHRAIFAVVPAGGPISPEERVAIDQAVTEGIRYWSASAAESDGLVALTSAEWRHLEDVLTLVGIVWLYILPGALIGLLLIRFRLTEPWAVTWILGLIGVVGLTSAIFFEPLFLQLHHLLFPAGNWIFPPRDYLLTQVYPASFFLAAWIIVLAFSGSLILGLRYVIGRTEQAAEESL